VRRIEQYDAEKYRYGQRDRCMVRGIDVWSEG
jgi:hypothetical protein